MNFLRNLALVIALVPLFALLDIFALVQMSLSFLFGTGERGWRIAVSKDQLGNASMGGHEDETFSSRCWRMRYKPKYARIKAAIDLFFFVVAGEIDHCKNSYFKEKQSCKNRFNKNESR